MIETHLNWLSDDDGHCTLFLQQQGADLRFLGRMQVIIGDAAYLEDLAGTRAIGHAPTLESLARSTPEAEAWMGEIHAAKRTRGSWSSTFLLPSQELQEAQAALAAAKRELDRKTRHIVALERELQKASDRIALIPAGDAEIKFTPERRRSELVGWQRSFKNDGFAADKHAKAHPGRQVSEIEDAARRIQQLQRARSRRLAANQSLCKTSSRATPEPGTDRLDAEQQPLTDEAIAEVALVCNGKRVSNCPCPHLVDTGRL